MQYLERIKKLQTVFDKLHIDALLIEDPTNILYLTGQDVSTGKLLVSKTSAYLLVDGRYFEKVRRNCSIPVHLSNEVNLKELLTSSAHPIHKLAFDSDRTSYKNYLELQHNIVEINKTHTPPLALIPVDNPVKKLRAIKDSSEIIRLKEAAELGAKGFDFILGLLKEGITEQELALELEIFWKRSGSKKTAFDPIIAFGANTSMPHYRAGQTKLSVGMPVLIDIGVNFQSYHSDMTRTVFFGDPSPKMNEIYKIVQRAQQVALDICRPGLSVGALDESARSFITGRGYGDYFSHSLGHGVGLEIHEDPTIRNKVPHNREHLVPGMVITIEPGIYLPGVGGVRIEDTIVVTEQGYDNLTKRPKELLVIH